MASLEESLIASAIEALNIEAYWPTFDGRKCVANDDGEFSVILCFYEGLLDHLVDRYSVTDAELQAAIKHLVSNYGRVANGKTPQDLDYNVPANCLGYLHRYAACHTALVHSVMLRLFHTCPPAAVRRLLALKGRLNLVMLGSGPGNDLVGVLAALYGKHYGLLHLDITAVDSMAGWRDVFQETAKRLREGLCGNASKIFEDASTVDASFLTADIKFPDSWPRDLRQKLWDADLIFMVKFLSIVPTADKLLVLKNIVNSMKPGSLLVFIDCPLPESEFVSLQNQLEVVYEDCKEKFQFDFEVQRFNYPNITVSRAFVRVFVKKFTVVNAS